MFRCQVVIRIVYCEASMKLVRAKNLDIRRGGGGKVEDCKIMVIIGFDDNGFVHVLPELTLA